MVSLQTKNKKLNGIKTIEYSFIDRNKYQQKYLLANVDLICQNVGEDINQSMKDEFFEFLRE